jgi:hypothetical protein
MFSLRAVGFFCSLDVLNEGLAIRKFQFLIQKYQIIKKKYQIIFSAVIFSIFGHHKTREADRYSGKNTGSGSGIN